MQRAGVDAEQSLVAAENLAWNDLVGRHNHGSERLPIMLRRVKAGVITGHFTPRLTRLSATASLPLAAPVLLGTTCCLLAARHLLRGTDPLTTIVLPSLAVAIVYAVALAVTQPLWRTQVANLLRGVCDRC